MPVSPSTPAASAPLTIPLPSDQDATGRSFGEDELARVADALSSGCLTPTRGKHTKRFEEDFAEWVGAGHAIACTSGSAAMHACIAALDLEPGDEVITTPITDMGSLAAILYCGAIPVFADVDPHTLNITPATVADRLSERTRAVIVTHLFGNPVDVDGVAAAVDASDGGAEIAILEDAAQALGARYRGRRCGVLGKAAAFSLQQGKHITTGEGGIVVTDDAALARRIFLFINKAWGYGDAKPDHYFLAPNYRMSELQGAVAGVQLGKLDAMVDRRLHAACHLIGRLEALPGLSTPPVRDGDTCAYWRIPIRIDPEVVPGGVDAVVAAVRELGVPAAPRYVQKPAFECEVIRDRKTFGTSGWPFNLARPEAVDYSREKFAGAYDGLEHVIILPLNEHFTQTHVDQVAGAFESAWPALATGAAAKGGAA